MLKPWGSPDLTEYWMSTSAFIFCNSKEVSYAHAEQLGIWSTAFEQTDPRMYKDVAFRL